MNESTAALTCRKHEGGVSLTVMHGPGGVIKTKNIHTHTFPLHSRHSKPRGMDKTDNMYSYAQSLSRLKYFNTRLQPKKYI